MADKTEAPTSRRIEDARTEGQVARSIELNAAGVMLIGAVLLSGPAASLVQGFSQVMTNALARMPKFELTQNSLQEIIFQDASAVILPVGIIMLGLLGVSAAITMAQTGFMWTSKNVGFNFNRVNPINGFKRIFSTHGLIELGRALLKLVVIGWVAYNYVTSNMNQMIALAGYDLATAAGMAAKLAISLMMSVGEVYLVLAAADYAYQRWTYMRQLRMTKEEIKEEYKRSEGDPQLKARIRGAMRRMARGRMMAQVPKATVVVTNPTHLAIAIEYHDGMNAPRVLAKGADKTAFRIAEIARENKIPVVQNIPLARAIYKTVEIDQEIPPDLYLAMAEVLAYVYKLRGLTSSGSPQPQPKPQPQATLS